MKLALIVQGAAARPAQSRSFHGNFIVLFVASSLSGLLFNYITLNRVVLPTRLV